MANPPLAQKREAWAIATATPPPATRPRLSAPGSTPGSQTSSTRPAPSTARRSQGPRLSGSGTGTVRKAFKTPFKAGIRPTPGSGPKYPSTSTPAHTPAPFAQPGDVSLGTPSRTNHDVPIRNSVVPPPAPPRLFDLNPQHAPARQTLLQSGIRPESISATEAIRRGCPEEVIVVLNTPEMAHGFEFLQTTNRTNGPREALHTLQQLGAKDLTLTWVRNHWDMILWKLAAMARHQPEHAVQRWWCWKELIRQLRYRYEREINRGQRSPLNRIKQHDSSAAQPMVLCVYKTE